MGDRLSSRVSWLSSPSCSELTLGPVVYEAFVCAQVPSVTTRLFILGSLSTAKETDKV